MEKERSVIAIIVDIIMQMLIGLLYFVAISLLLLLVCFIIIVICSLFEEIAYKIKLKWRKRNGKE